MPRCGVMCRADPAGSVEPTASASEGESLDETPQSGTDPAHPSLRRLYGYRCPGAQGSPSPSPSSSSALPVFRELAQCFRAHGVPNFPDPVVDAQGKIRLDAPANMPLSAEQACKSIAQRLPAQGKDKPYTAAEMANLRKLAQCFRQHGVTDWPDPDAGGIFRVSQRLQDLGKRAWLPAREACLQYFVRNGISVMGPNDQKGSK
jgi:hypothetical protein